MNDMEKFLNFGAVVKIRRSYDEDLFKFIELMKSVGFLNEYIDYFEKTAVLMTGLMNFRKICFGIMLH